MKALNHWFPKWAVERWGGGEAKGGGWGGDRMSFVAINNVLLYILGRFSLKSRR